MIALIGRPIPYSKGLFSADGGGCYTKACGLGSLVLVVLGECLGLHPHGNKPPCRLTAGCGTEAVVSSADCASVS